MTASVLPTDLPDNWLDTLLSDANRHRGRTGCQPCLGADAYMDGAALRRGLPTAAASALHDLLDAASLPSGTVVGCAVEPPASEATELHQLAKRRAVSGIIFASTHPDPDQRGCVTTALRDAGVPVATIPAEDTIAEADRRYWVWARYRRSYVHLKISLTADGAMVPVPGRTTRLAGPSSRARIHRLRGQYDAILIGARTVRQDDPRMTYRGDENLPQPRKIILTRTRDLGANRRALQGAPPILCAGTNLVALAQRWAEDGITGVLVEGGGDIYRQFVEQRAADEISLVWSSMLSDGNGIALPGGLPLGTLETVGEDVWETIRWPASEEGHAEPNARTRITSAQAHHHA